jgi:hypothetical protein
MAFTIDAEAKKWECDPMNQGKMYRSSCERELISDQDLENYFYDDVLIALPAFIETTTHIVYLDKKIIEYVSAEPDQKAYQTFIKVITDNGDIGWVIWFKNEWKEIKSCQ